jgi:hypothetical protein
MSASKSVALCAVATLILGACASGREPARKPGGPAKAAGSAIPFEQARLIVEINATDGDAGLQLFLDHDTWKSIGLTRPDRSQILDIKTEGVLQDYGLTELFSESSEPSFEEFPLTEFKKIFPEGEYRLTGTTIDGKELESMVTLTHDFPAAPKVTAPAKGATVSGADTTITWDPVTEPEGIEIVRYQVTVEGGNPLRVFSVDLPPTATTVRVPAEFLDEPGDYKLEVLAVEKNRNQTLTEIPFKVS